MIYLFIYLFIFFFLRTWHMFLRRTRETYPKIRYESTPIHIYRKFHFQKNWKFADKKFWYFFHISAQNIDCGYSLKPPRRGGSNEYSQSMFLNRNKKNNVTPVNPSLLYKSGGLRGSPLYIGMVFVMIIKYPFTTSLLASVSFFRRGPFIVDVL